MAGNGAKVVVVVVPFPAQGHLTPLLRLSRSISARNIPVHFVAADIHIRQATARVHGWEDDHSAAAAAANLHLHGFPTPPFENLSPDANASHKYPNHQGPMVRAVLHSLHEPLRRLVNKLAAAAEEEHNDKRVVIVFDSLMASIVKSVHSSPNVESYCYESISAFTSHASRWEIAGKPDLPPEAAAALRELPSPVGCLNPEFQEYIKLQYMSRTFHSGTLYNTSRLIEGLYLDLLSKLVTDKRYAIGPLNPVSPDSTGQDSDCLEWLDKQPKDSVMFVSFGTAATLCDEQIIELALGLERSGHRFVWVLRDADRGDIFEGDDRRAELPQGFEERVGERGIVVRDWAPQLEILEHSATGGFMTHCGWNSLMESMSMGVPIAAWPMHSDQPRNALLMTKVVKIGVDVRDWARKDEIVSSSLVEEAVKRVMEGAEMRQRAEKLGVSIRESMMEGGASRMEMDSFIAQITR